MANQKIVHAATASGLTLLILPAFAQDNPGVQFTAGIEQKFEAGDNLALEDPEEGSTALSTTTLSFGVVTETVGQSLTLDGRVSLRAGEVPANSDIDTGLVEPQIRFSYNRDVANSALSVDGSYRESDVSFNPAVTDFTDLNGQIQLPPDFEDLEGSGTRRSYRLNTELAVAQNAPLNFVFDASVRGISYDQQAASLNDNFRYSAGARANLRFSEVTTGFVSYNFDHFESDDNANTDRDTSAFEVGVSQQLSPRASFEAAIGFTDISETQNNISSSTSGATGRLSFSLAMPDGNLTGSFTTTRDQDGARHNLLFGRSYVLPTGALDFSIGATKESGSDVGLIGSVNYTQDLPTGSVRVGINRNVTVNNNDEERISTTADIGYSHSINDLSSIGLDLSFGLVDGDGNSDDTRQADISASYNYDLTEDWKLSTGVAYKVREEDNSSTSDSTSIFVTLRRDFEFFR